MTYTNLHSLFPCTKTAGEKGRLRVTTDKKKIGIKVGKPNTLLKKHYKLVKNYEIVFKYFLRVFSVIILVHLQTEFSLTPISSYAINFFLFKATKFLTFSIRRRTKEYVQNFFE